MAKKSNDDIVKEFKEAVNMTAAKLEKYLETDESKAVGQKKGGDDSESTGHAMGKTIVELLRKKKGDYDDDDYAHMRKVVSYVHRHLAQRPEGDITDTNWRHSLMNWGHDPAK